MSGLLYFIVKRILTGIVVVWAIITVVFLLEHAPGAADPIRMILGNHFTQGSYTQLLHEYNLDVGLPAQYLNYLGLAPVLSWFGVHFGSGPVQSGLLEGSLGYSYHYQGTPVVDLLSAGVPVTLKLGAYSLILSLIVGLPVGLISALRQNSLIDHLGQGTMMVLYALPTFVMVPILQDIFALRLGWFPPTGWGNSPSQEVLPIVAYAAGLAGFFAKSFRSFLLEVLTQDYIRTARAKGLRQNIIIWRHAVKNTLLPLASVVGPVIAYLIVGAFVIEDFFDIPGIANETVQAIFQGDNGVIEGTTIMLAVFVVIVNMLTDIFYSVVDPRVRL